MPLYDEKFLSPFAIRFSQARIRPTFQDGRFVEKSMGQVEAVQWPYEESDGYDVLLRAPFPPISIIRWRPKLRDQDGTTIVNEDGSQLLGDACWFTFDNRRLYCLQAAAAKHWPRRAAAVVHVMRDLPISRSTPRKFRTTDSGCSVAISRRNDPVPRAIWNWSQATRSVPPGQLEASRAAMERVEADIGKEDWDELVDVPCDFEEQSSAGAALEPLRALPVPPPLPEEVPPNEDLPAAAWAWPSAPSRPEAARAPKPQPQPQRPSPAQQLSQQHQHQLRQHAQLLMQHQQLQLLQAAAASYAGLGIGGRQFGANGHGHFLANSSIASAAAAAAAAAAVAGGGGMTVAALAAARQELELAMALASAPGIAAGTALGAGGPRPPFDYWDPDFGVSKAPGFGFVGGSGGAVGLGHQLQGSAGLNSGGSPGGALGTKGNGSGSGSLTAASTAASTPSAGPAAPASMLPMPTAGGPDDDDEENCVQQ